MKNYSKINALTQTIDEIRKFAFPIIVDKTHDKTKITTKGK